RGARGTCFGAQERAEAGAQGAVARRPRGTGMRAGRGGGGRMRVLVIDNYDSFTYNLVQLAGSLGADVVVRRNDEVTVEALRALRRRRRHGRASSHTAARGRPVPPRVDPDRGWRAHDAELPRAGVMEFRDALTRILSGRDLSRDEAESVMRRVMEGEATPAQ